MTRRLAIGLLGLLGLIGLIALVGVACTGDDATVERRLLALGTWVDIRIEGVEQPAAEDALAEAEGVLRRIERDYHAWNDGELAALNEAIAAGRPMRVSPGLARLLATSKRLAAATNGVFDPGIGALVALWGFHGDADAPDEPPDTARIEEWVAHGDSIAGIDIRDGVVTSTSRSLVIDLGGIAKGEAVDRVVEILGTHSIERALVNAGGDVRVLGRRAERPWRVGVRAPRGEGLLGTIELEPGEAAFTSGDYENFFVHAGQRMHHILSPATGRPVTHTQAVTVLAGDGVTADAAATALLVAGPDAWRDVAAALGVAAALRVDASGRVQATPAMRDRLQTVEGVRLDIMRASE